MFGEFETIHVTVRERVGEVTLARPDVHNAFNAAMIRELHEVFESVRTEASSHNRNIRVVVLKGAGPSFCAGADVNWMRESLNYSLEEMHELLDQRKHENNTWRIGTIEHRNTEHDAGV